MTTKPNNQWDIEEAHRTLQRAAAIQSDKKMMKDVVAHHETLSKMLKGGMTKSTPVKTVSKSNKKK